MLLLKQVSLNFAFNAKDVVLLCNNPHSLWSSNIFQKTQHLYYHLTIT